MIPEEIEKLILNIKKLDKIYHKYIYIVLRKTRPESYFPSNNKETRFNIFMLNDYEREILSRCLEICLKHQKYQNNLISILKEKNENPISVSLYC